MGMENYVIILTVAGLLAASVFFSYIKGIGKTFANNPAIVDSSSTKDQMQKTIDDTKEKQQQMMADIKQKIEDARRNR